MLDGRAYKKVWSSELRFLILMVASVLGLLAYLNISEVIRTYVSPANCASINEGWQNDFQNKLRFDDTWEKGAFECPSGKYYFVKALQLLNELNFDEDKTYLQWVQQVDPIISKQWMIRFIGRTTYENNQISINPDVFKKESPVEIAGIIVHEARHLEQGKNTHVPCLKHRGLTCDDKLHENPFDGGAYNYGIMFYAAFAEHGLNGNQLEDARILMKSTLDSKFNNVSEGQCEFYLALFRN